MAATSLPAPTFTAASDGRVYQNHPITLLIDQCSSVKHLKQIHAHMLRCGLLSDPFSASKLVGLCALSNLSSIDYAEMVFDQIPQPNLFSWNALVRAYASTSQPIHSLSFFIRMLHHCRDLPNKFTYPFVIKASAELLDIRLGKGIHGMVFKAGYSTDLFISNSLIRLYADCGCLDMAYQVFDSLPERDVVTWNSMINGLIQNGCFEQGVNLIHTMENSGVIPNDITMISLLSAAVKKPDLELGRWVHSYLRKNSIKQSLILDNALLDMYSKCGSMEDAREVFDVMKEKDVVTWTTMLAGYAKLGDFRAARDLFDALPSKDIAAWNALISAYEQSGNAKEAIAVFNELQQSNVKPDEVTLVSTLSACSQLGAIQLGAWIHAYVKKDGMKLNRHLSTALIDMYSKCGDLDKAREIFESSERRDVFVWSAMIAGFGMHGCGQEALDLFSKMQEAKVMPSVVTFTNLLSACSHSRLVEEGVELFHQMEHVYGIQPDIEHYACLVDILGRAGQMERAMDLIRNMPMAPGASIWGALLGACKLHKDLELAEYACKQLLEIEPQNHGALVLLSNIYADSGKWEEVSMLRKRMRDVGLKKEPGCSTIKVNGIVHEFLVGDNAHPMSKEIYMKLEEIETRLKSVGHVPNKSQVLQMVEEEEMQEKALYLHSERLAVAFGLISCGPAQTIRIFKNLRVCEDCHSVFKLVSKIYERGSF